MTDAPEPSRRHFLATSALGLLGIVSRPMILAHGGGSPPDGELLYVGTYTAADRTDGIFLVHMDTRSGELRRIASVDAGPNPSFIAIHPNGALLYAVNEVEERNGRATGAVSAFAMDRGDGGLTRLNVQASEGAAPCYVSVDRGSRVVLVANYAGGNVALLPIQGDGTLGAATHVSQHRHGAGTAHQKQQPHAHCIVADPSNRFVLAADLGLDRVFVYRLDGGTLRHEEGNDATLRTGAGPRHLAFHPTLPVVYAANELDSTVTALGFDRERGALTTLETRSTLPPGWAGKSYVADIHVAPSGRTVYVSNRGHNSIAVFSVADATGALTLEQTVSTEGDWPRNFSLDPTGRWLLVANQRSGSIVVFARDQDTGRLAPTERRLEIPGPACLRFRAHTGVTT
jgi:6-phosphogluconolactonase